MSLKLLAVLAGTATATQTGIANTRDVATGFWHYCDQTSLTWYPGSDQTAIIADCSTDGNPVYYESWIDLNYCFVNSNGYMKFQLEGYAMSSCSCEMGEQIDACRPNCNSTQLQCTCDDGQNGDKVTELDLDEYIGLGFDSNNHLVLECYDPQAKALVQGSFMQCIKYGQTVDCE